MLVAWGAEPAVITITKSKPHAAIPSPQDHLGGYQPAVVPPDRAMVKRTDLKSLCASSCRRTLRPAKFLHCFPIRLQFSVAFGILSHHLVAPFGCVGWENA
jgi:hypothetical protein